MASLLNVAGFSVLQLTFVLCICTSLSDSGSPAAVDIHDIPTIPVAGVPAVVGLPA
jgi:hypothetical protein